MLATAAPSTAQEEEPPAATEESAAEQADAARVVPEVNGQIAPVGPDTFILLDAQGRPQPVLGMTYEEFIAAWEKLRNLDGEVQTPTFQMESLTAEGRLEGDAAVLDVRFEIVVNRSGLVEIPLGFQNAILHKLDVADESIQLSYDAQRGGYIAWIHGQGEEHKSLSLPLSVPLNRDGNRLSLQTNVPRALVNQLVLDAASRIASPTVSEGAIVKLADRGENGSRLAVTGLAGDVVLSWQEPGLETTAVSTVLSVAGEIETTVDGRSARSQASLHVESFGGKFQQFRVRLPPGAQLVPQGEVEATENRPSYELRPVNSPPDRSESRGQIWSVFLNEATAGPVEVRLVTEQAIGLSRGEEFTELAGFEVLGAVRQFGELALWVDPSWQLRWNRLEGGRQISVDDLEQDTDAEASLFAFAYDQQPWSLPVEVRQRDTRVAVSPKYQLKITPEEALLRVTLQYQLAGSQTMQFRVKLAGWEVTADPIEPTRLIDADQTQTTSDDGSDDIILEIPFTEPAARRTEITFTARRSLSDLRSQIELPLPTPLADSVGTGELVVFADPSLLVTPHAEQSGLATRPVTGESDSNEEMGFTQVASYRSFRDEPNGELAFSAEVTPRVGEVQAEIESFVDVGRQFAEVGHVLNFEAKYRPVRELAFSMPTRLSRNSSLQISLVPGDDSVGNGRTAEGVPLEVRSFENGGAFDTEEEMEVVTVALPQPRLGRFRLRFDYEVPTNIARDSTLASATVPLPAPVQIPVTSQVATVELRDLDQLELAPNERDSVWSVTSDGPAATNGEVVMKTDGAAASLPLLFRSVRRAGEGRTIVERSWVQSWYAEDAHQQRAVYRIKSNARSLTIELPLTLSETEVEVVLDGYPFSDFERREAQIVLRLPETVEPTVHIVELRYLLSDVLEPVSELRHELPQIGGDSDLAEFYWQVVLPNNYWVVQGPNNLTKAHQWKWSLSGLRPVPQASTRTLEASSGALNRRAPAVGEAEYLYSGIGPGRSLEIKVARSELVLLAAASAVLVVGLGLLYLPILRKPAVLFTLALALVTAGTAYPEWMLLCGPALAFGAGLALLASLLFFILPRPVTPDASAPASTAYVTQGSREKHQLPSTGAVSTNAPTITLRASESKA